VRENLEIEWRRREKHVSLTIHIDGHHKFSAAISGSIPHMPRREREREREREVQLIAEHEVQELVRAFADVEARQLWFHE
jgi:hypothetical protein